MPSTPVKLHLLAIGAHPDDVELSCSGTLLAHMDKGYTAGILDLTRGELGTRGSAELRMEEANRAAGVLGISARGNAGLPDGFFTRSEESIRTVIPFIRAWRPDIVLATAPTDRHPDHGRAAELIREACFFSGLPKIETSWEGEPQSAWRPKAIYHYVQDRYLQPSLVVDISPYMDKKFEAILAFSSQFYDPDSKEPSTPISSAEFLESIRAKNRLHGRIGGYEYGEGFICERAPGVRDLFFLD